MIPKIFLKSLKFVAMIGFPAKLSKQQNSQTIWFIGFYKALYFN